MDRCKLEYMYKNLEFKEKKKRVRLMDPDADYEFKKDMSRFLVNPETDDIDILFLIGPYHTLYYTIYRCEGETEVLESYRKDKDQEKLEILEKFIDIYKSINDLCINNNTYPFFEDPTNVKECEKVRLDLVKKIPENLLNNYFGVESFGDYSPPKYNGEK